MIESLGRGRGGVSGGTPDGTGSSAVAQRCQPSAVRSP
ncbi:hypothetical protein SLI_8073 [Streptomyces lividans 1326]|uniref:Uncharacterized protein n=1 Tax=Streptomyces lividans 1326 TaxID=1200984 RepID=A0A7U9DZ05_STRLI|nr:hypothetical protein SLI_8073 [Streptomyces lividans 1326]